MGDHDGVGFDPVIELDGVRVFHGDCRDVLAGLPDDSVDSIVTDPPYELGFMGKKWDASGIAYDLTVWGECLRVLKPGGHLLAFGGTRTWHRLAVAVEDAGFEIRDNIAWMYGSGFPKSLDVSKAIDKNNGKHEVDLTPFGRYVKELRQAQGWSRKQLDDVMGTNTAVSWWEGRASGVQLPSKETYNRLKVVLGMDGRFDSLIDWAEAEREVIGKGSSTLIAESGTYAITNGEKSETWKPKEYDITAPATAEAEKWSGWGTALKPAFEPIVVARKPLSGTVAETVLEWGTGGLNIDGSRIGTSQADLKELNRGNKRPIGSNYSENTAFPIACENRETKSAQGRWPANVILDEYTADLLDQQSGVSVSRRGVNPDFGRKGGIMGVKTPRHDAGTPTGHDDSGGASRFFYCAKASKRDRNEGLEGLEQKQSVGGGGGIGDYLDDVNSASGKYGSEKAPAKNFHPTVKPTALMRYLVKLVTPPGGTVLDPFTGSGSTGKAAVLEGFEFVGVELTDDYLPIIEGRLKWAIENQDEDTLF